jgi:hypothetical protein
MRERLRPRDAQRGRHRLALASFRDIAIDKLVGFRIKGAELSNDLVESIHGALWFVHFDCLMQKASSGFPRGRGLPFRHVVPEGLAYPDRDSLLAPCARKGGPTSEAEANVSRNAEACVHRVSSTESSIVYLGSDAGTVVLEAHGSER